MSHDRVFKSMKHYSRCPTPYKVRWNHRGDAEDRAWLDTIIFQKRRQVYRCRCGKFHIRTKNKGRTKAQIRRSQIRAEINKGYFRQKIADAIAELSNR